MPDRKVGRPLGSRVSDRVSVIFRIDRELWGEFQNAEEAGRIQDRTNFINDALRRSLTQTQTVSRKAL